jgi:hypothetical protein
MLKRLSKHAKTPDQRTVVIQKPYCRQKFYLHLKRLNETSSIIPFAEFDVAFFGQGVE